MNVQKMLKIFLLSLIALFIIGQSSFAYNLDSITFGVSAEYIHPLEIELENDGNWDLGEYIITSNTPINKSFDIKAITPANTRVSIKAQSDGREFSQSGDISLYKDENDSSNLTVSWSISEKEFTTNASGEHTTKIDFSTVKETNNPTGGNYSGSSPMIIKMETL